MLSEISQMEKTKYHMISSMESREKKKHHGKRDPIFGYYE